MMCPSTGSQIWTKISITDDIVSAVNIVYN